MTTEQTTQDAAHMAEIGHLLRTQDNRITDAPLFIVQERRRTYGFDPAYSEDIVWLDCEGDEVDAEEQARIEKLRDNGEVIQVGWTRTAYQDTWHFVTACFTEAGCNDYIARNGHNHRGKLRVYAAGSWRNEEWRSVYRFLRQIGEAPGHVSIPRRTLEKLVDATRRNHDVREAREAAEHVLLHDALRHEPARHDAEAAEGREALHMADSEALRAKLAAAEAQIDEIRWAADQLRPYGAEARVDFGGVGQAIRSLLAAVDTVAGGALCWCGHDHAQHAHGDCEAKLDSETTCVCEGFADRRPDSTPPPAPDMCVCGHGKGDHTAAGHRACTAVLGVDARCVCRGYSRGAPSENAFGRAIRTMHAPKEAPAPGHVSIQRRALEKLVDATAWHEGAREAREQAKRILQRAPLADEPARTDPEAARRLSEARAERDRLEAKVRSYDGGEAPIPIDLPPDAYHERDRADRLQAMLQACEVELATARAQLQQTERAAGAHVATIERLQEQIAAAHRAAHAPARSLEARAEIAWRAWDEAPDSAPGGAPPPEATGWDSVYPGAKAAWRAVVRACDTSAAPAEQIPGVAAADALTESERREGYQIGKQTGIGFAAGCQAIAESKARKKAAADDEPAPETQPSARLTATREEPRP